MPPAPPARRCRAAPCPARAQEPCAAVQPAPCAGAAAAAWVASRAATSLWQDGPSARPKTSHSRARK
eukprot:6507110-Lingulodinium_polyedra.AAC.1